MKKLLLVAMLFFAVPLFAQHQNTITWLAPVGSTPTGYNMYRFAGPCGQPLSAFTRLNATPLTALSFTDSGMSDGAVNCYQVTAVYPTGESGSSGALQATTPTFTATVVLTPPGAPSTVSQ